MDKQNQDWKVTAEIPPSRRRRLKRTKSVDLPWDIIYNILARVPLKSLLRFKTVSKRFDNLTRDPKFLELHASNPSSNCFILSKNTGLRGLFLLEKENHEWTITAERTIDCELRAIIPSLEIASTCNGFLCLADFDDKEITLYNPITRQIRQTPKLLCNGYRWKGVYCVKDAQIKKYKILVVASLNFEYICFIMTLGDAYWRKIEIAQNFQWYNCQRAVSSSGEIYWIVGIPYGVLGVLIMDIVNEVFRVIKFPDEYKAFQIDLHDYRNSSLLVYGRHVSLFVTIPVPGQSFDMEVQVWTLMDSKRGIWVRKTIRENIFMENVEVVNTVEDDSLLLKLNNIGCHFVIYKPQSGNVSFILSPGDPRIYDLFSFSPSLESLYDS